MNRDADPDTFPVTGSESGVLRHKLEGWGMGVETNINITTVSIYLSPPMHPKTSSLTNKIDASLSCSEFPMGRGETTEVLLFAD